LRGVSSFLNAGALTNQSQLGYGANNQIPALMQLYADSLWPRINAYQDDALMGDMGEGGSEMGLDGIREMGV
jgi:hypothetical protein